jgi:hypothetical protein
MRQSKSLIGAAVVISIILIGPYFVGGAYAVLALPAYGVVCRSPQTSYTNGGFLQINVTEEDYLEFLFNRGCGVRDATDRQRSAPPEYPPPRYYNDDFIGDFLTIFGAWIAKHFIIGVYAMVWATLPLIRRSVLFRAFLYLLYLAISVVVIQMLNIAVQSAAHKLCKVDDRRHGSEG